jgi:hypothetical protein
MSGPSSGRKWGKRLAVGAVAVLLIGGGAVAMSWSTLKAGWAAKAVRAAGSDEARAAAAANLVALGESGLPRVVELLKSDDAAGCLAVAAALREAWKDTPPADPAFAAKCRPILADAAAYSEAGKDAVLELAADAMRCPDADLAALGRAAVRAALTATAPDAVARAAAVASLPEVGLKAELVPLLRDERAEVRRAAMMAVGPAARGEPVIGDEELFPWLHDPDVEVRAVCESALATRGMDGDQIAAARKLTHPDAAERLKLLLDLRWGRDTVRDPGPWLERLSRDADPAVRAGAARVACECRLTFAGWLDRLATEDPDGTVRDVAAYYRAKAAEIRPAGFVDR